MLLSDSLDEQLFPPINQLMSVHIQNCSCMPRFLDSFISQVSLVFPIAKSIFAIRVSPRLCLTISSVEYVQPVSYVE